MNTEKISPFAIEVKLRTLIATENYSKIPGITDGRGNTQIELDDCAIEFDYSMAVVEGDHVTSIRVELTDIVDDECSDQKHALQHSQVLEFLIECYVKRYSSKWVENELQALKKRVQKSQFTV